MRTQWRLPSAAVGGTRRRGGWLLNPYLSIWWRQWLFGVSWHDDDYEAGDPKVVLHLGPVVLWCRFLRIAPGYRAKRRARLSGVE